MAKKMTWADAFLKIALIFEKAMKDNQNTPKVKVVTKPKKK